MPCAHDMPYMPLMDVDHVDFSSLSALQAEAWHDISILVLICKQTHPYHSLQETPLLLCCSPVVAKNFPRYTASLCSRKLALSSIVASNVSRHVAGLGVVQF